MNPAYKKKLTYLLLLLNIQTIRKRDYCQAPDAEAFFKETNQLYCGALIT